MDSYFYQLHLDRINRICRISFWPFSRRKRSNPMRQRRTSRLRRIGSKLIPRSRI